MDFVRLCALARLNWRLLDPGLLEFSANRAGMAQQLAAQRAAWEQQQQQQSRLLRQKQALEDQRANSSLGQAAIAIGASPGDFRIPTTSPPPSWGGGGGLADPPAQLHANMHQLLVRVAALQGQPDPQVAPVLAGRAVDILHGRVAAPELVSLIRDSVPPAQRAVLGLVTKVPFLGDKLLGPIAVMAAANAAPLGVLYRLVPDALLPGQPVPVGEPAMPDPPAAAPLIRAAVQQLASSAADALLAQAMAADAAHADQLYLAALDAAERTPTIDDDIAVLHQLAQASGDRAPSEPVVRRAEALVSAMAARPEHRDAVAFLLAWLAYAAVARGLVDALGPRLLKSCQAVLGAPGLGNAAAVRLSGAAVELLVRTGKPDKASALVDLMQRRASDPALWQELLLMRARIARGVSPADPAVAAPRMAGLVPQDVRAALGGSLLWEDWRGDFAAAGQLLDTRSSDPIARAIVLAASGQAGAAMRTLNESAAPSVAALHALRYAQYMNAKSLPGGNSQDDVYLRYASAQIVQKFPPDLAPPSLAEQADRAALAEFGLALTARGITSLAALTPPSMLRATLGTSIPDGFDDGANASAATPLAPGPRSPAWVALAAADLHHRDGNDALAQQFLVAARRAAAGDAHAHGEIALVEGHWAACALESPLTLGLRLEANDAHSGSPVGEPVERREHATPGPAAIGAAAAAYDRAERAFEHGHARRGLAAVVLSRAGLAALAGDHRRARTLAAEAERRFAELGDELGRYLARTHAVIAATATGEPIDPDQVRAIAAWGMSDGSLSFMIGCARLVSRSGRRALFRDGDLERALALYDLAYELLAATPLDVLTAQTLVDRANALRLANDLDAAAELAERAAALLATARLGAPADVALRRANMLQFAWALQNARGDADGLDRHAQQIAAMLDQLQRAGEGAGAVEELMLMTSYLAHAVQISPAVSALYRARDLNEDPESTPSGREAAWQRALDAARAIPESEGLQCEGLLHAARGDDAAAATTFRRLYSDSDAVARATAAEANLPEPLADQARTQRDMLAISSFLRARDTASARAAYDRLIAHDPDWAHRGGTPWDSLVDVAELHAAEGDVPAALAAYQEAINLVEARRSLLTQDSLKRNFVDTSPIHAMYAGAARVALDGEPARAFDYAERGRARALLDLASDRSRGASAWRAYNTQVGMLHNLLSLEHERPRPDSERIAALRARLAAVEAGRPAVPEHAGLDPSAAIATLDAVAADLPADTVLLQYALADDVLLAWAISQSGMVAHRTVRVRTAELRRAARGFRAACDTGGDVVAPGGYLSDLLLAPFAAAILGAAHVVIVPTDALHLVPFHALPFGDRTLIDAAAVSYAPSASLAHVLGRGAVPTGALVAVGDPAGMTYVDDRGVSQPLQPLPGAGAEARRIAAAYPGAQPALTGAAATLAALRTRIPGARIVHLATHGVLSVRSPWLSTIALANGEGLDLAALGNVDLQADLVALSACDTARGAVGKSDEVFGFARGLIAAGARRALISLWAVSDLAACELMTVFYRELGAGAPVAQALRTAQLHVRDLDANAVANLAAQLAVDGTTIAPRSRRDILGGNVPDHAGFTHPSFWAPFVLVGL